MTSPKVLLVDDSDVIRLSLSRVLNAEGFHVTTASNVPEALRRIQSDVYDVLLSDLHMPDAGDGLTVVSAMRHSNPKAVTLLLSAFPEMNAAASAILLQADEILVKPMEVPALIDVIKQRLAHGPARTRVVETGAKIIERTADNSIEVWYESVEKQAVLSAIRMSRELRIQHLPQLFRDLIRRLRSTEPLGTNAHKSESATLHGQARRKQGYSAAMMVEESRILQVTLFNSLQNNLSSIDFSVVLLDVMTIADEVDSQLSQAMQSFLLEPSATELVA